MLLFTNPIVFHQEEEKMLKKEVQAPSPDPHDPLVIVVTVMAYQPADLDEEPQPPAAVEHTVSVSTHWVVYGIWLVSVHTETEAEEVMTGTLVSSVQIDGYGTSTTVEVVTGFQMVVTYGVEVVI